MDRSYEVRFRDVIDILRRRWVFVRNVLLVALGLGALSTLLLQPVYRATVTITADKTPPVVLLEQPGGASGSGSTVGTVAGVGSPDVPTLVALAKSQTVQDDAVVRLSRTIGERRARTILAHLRVQPVWNTELVHVSVDYRDPQLAATAANAVSASLVDMDLHARRRWAQEMRRSVQDQLVAADPRLRTAEEALVVFKRHYGDVPLSEKTTMSLNRLAQLEAQRVDVRVQQKEARARADTARNRLASQARISPIQWAPNPLINTLEGQLAAQEIELSGLHRLFTPKHPSVVGQVAKIEETRRRLDAELGRTLQIGQYGVDPVYQQLVQQVRQDEVATAALETRDQALGAVIAQYEQELQQLPVRELSEARLSRDAKEAQEIHSLLTGKLQQALVAAASIGSAVRVVDTAQPPAAPVRARWLGLFVSAILGMVAGIGGALLQEQVDDPIKSPEQAERTLQTPLLGAIPRTRIPKGPAWGDRWSINIKSARLWSARRPGAEPPRKDVGVEAADRARSAFAESFRYLRTNLILLHKQLPRTLLVTSPGNDAAKDVVGANLAIALAQAGLRVWLVDADLRKRSLTDTHAFRPEKSAEGSEGLAEWLGNDVPGGNLLRATAIQNLSFLPAGTPPPNPAELLGSPKMRAFLKQDRDDVDIIVLVAPPLLPVADAAVLAPEVEGVLLAVRVGVTPRYAARKAQQHLDAVGGRLMGVVVTDVSTGGISWYDRAAAGYYEPAPSDIWYLGAPQHSSLS